MEQEDLKPIETEDIKNKAKEFKENWKKNKEKDPLWRAIDLILMLGLIGLMAYAHWEGVYRKTYVVIADCGGEIPYQIAQVSEKEYLEYKEKIEEFNSNIGTAGQDLIKPFTTSIAEQNKTCTNGSETCGTI